MPTAAILEFRRALNESDGDTLKFFATIDGDRRERQRRQSHASALIALCRAEMKATQGESIEDRRERLRREADRAEYKLKAFRAAERGDHVAAHFFGALARAAS